MISSQLIMVRSCDDRALILITSSLFPLISNPVTPAWDKKTAENTESAEKEEERESLNNSDTNGNDIRDENLSYQRSLNYN